MGTHDMLREMKSSGAKAYRHKGSSSTSRILVCAPSSLDEGYTPSYNGALIRPNTDAERRVRFC